MTRPLALLLGSIVAVAVAFLVSPACSDVTPSTAPTSRPAPPLAGRWTGSAHIVNDFVRATTLAVEVEIHDDLTVTGRVGDATLTNGRLISNVGSLARAANLGRDYEIRGDLTGPLIADEQITRAGVIIPFNHDPATDTLHRGVNTTGTPFGGKDKVVVAAKDLRLRRQ
jgi:hypothetical protein